MVPGLPKMAPALLLVGLLSACSSKEAKVESTAPVYAASRYVDSIAEEPGSRLVVARVNGVPVYEDCVRHQAASRELTPREALEECIAFELLAQRAQSKGLLEDRQVQQEAKQAAVRKLIDEDFHLRGPEDIPDRLVEALWNQVRIRYDHDEMRSMVFCRLKLPREAKPGDEDYDQGLAFLEDIYQRLKDRDDLEKNDLFGECHPHWKEAGIKQLQLLTFPTKPMKGYVPTYHKPVFEDGAQGKVLPPIRVRLGLELILVTNVVEPLHRSFEEVEPELRKALFEEKVYEPQREELFAQWVEPMLESATVESYPERLPEGSYFAGHTMAPARGKLPPGAP